MLPSKFYSVIFPPQASHSHLGTLQHNHAPIQSHSTAELSTETNPLPLPTLSQFIHNWSPNSLPPICYGKFMPYWETICSLVWASAVLNDHESPERVSPGDSCCGWGNGFFFSCHWLSLFINIKCPIQDRDILHYHYSAYESSELKWLRTFWIICIS